MDLGAVLARGPAVALVDDFAAAGGLAGPAGPRPHLPGGAAGLRPRAQRHPAGAWHHPPHLAGRAAARSQHQIAGNPPRRRTRRAHRHLHTHRQRRSGCGVCEVLRIVARRAESRAPGRTTMSAQFEPDPRNADKSAAAALTAARSPRDRWSSPPAFTCRRLAVPAPACPAEALTSPAAGSASPRGRDERRSSRTAVRPEPARWPPPRTSRSWLPVTRGYRRPVLAPRAGGL